MLSRDELIEMIAERATEATDLESLMNAFHEKQVNYLEDADIDELKELAEIWNIDEQINFGE